MKKTNHLFYYFFAIIISIGTLLNGQVNSGNLKINELNYIYGEEKINLHTDRDIYVAGDNLFFKLYLNNIDSNVTPQISNYAYIIFRSDKANIIKTLIKVENRNAFGTIYIPDTLKSGMYQLVAFTNYMRNFEEKSFFYKNILVINRFDKSFNVFYDKEFTDNNSRHPKTDISEYGNIKSLLKIELEKDSFYIREKIRIKLKYSVRNQHKANLSITVKEINPLTDSINYQSFENSTSQQIVRKNDENENLSNFNKLFLPEKRGIYLFGNISNQIPSQKDECIYISSPDTFANLQYTYSDEYGNFHFLLNDYYLGREVILKKKNNLIQNYSNKIILDDKFNLANIFTPSLPELTIELKKYFFNCQDIMHIQKSYNRNILEIKLSNEKKSNSLPYVFRNYTTTIKPEDFVPLDNFYEIISNILIGVKVERKKKEYEAYVFNYLTDTYFNHQPTIFLDGIPIDNLNQIMKLSSVDIKKIEICNALKFKGNINFPGILSILSKKNLIEMVQFYEPYKKLTLERFLEKVNYITPEYETQTYQDNVPDFRQLLYWNPEVNILPDEIAVLEFFASDYLTDYLVEVFGFLEDGTPVQSYSKIKVYR